MRSHSPVYPCERHCARLCRSPSAWGSQLRGCGSGWRKEAGGGFKVPGQPKHPYSANPPFFHQGVQGDDVSLGTERGNNSMTEAGAPMIERCTAFQRPQHRVGGSFLLFAACPNVSLLILACCFKERHSQEVVGCLSQCWTMQTSCVGASLLKTNDH